MCPAEQVASAAPAVPADVSAVPPVGQLNAAALREFGHLLDFTGRELRRNIGDEATVILLNKFPGCQFPVPLCTRANRHGAVRFQRFANLIGTEAARRLSAYWGGTMLDVPICGPLRHAVRDRWLRARFDVLTSPTGRNLSSNAALCELCEALAAAGAPLSFRTVQVIVNKGE